jgi:IQ and AAA domain-containing protein
MFDLRNYLTEELFMKMGSQFLRDSKELDRPNYFHFFGPHGAGKTLIVRALATMLDCMVLDLSPSNLTEEHIKDKNAIAKMLYMTFTVAKEFQPAIIYIDEVELLFKGKKK